jgi:hypothetical protein
MMDPTPQIPDLVVKKTWFVKEGSHVKTASCLRGTTTLAGLKRLYPSSAAGRNPLVGRVDGEKSDVLAKVHPVKRARNAVVHSAVNSQVTHQTI